MKKTKKDPGCVAGGGDFVVMGPKLENGDIMAVRHTADHQLLEGVVRPLQDGRPITGELVEITHRNDNIYNISPISLGEKTSDGPAMVNSAAYQSGWDNIFGKTVVGKS